MIRLFVSMFLFALMVQCKPDAGIDLREVKWIHGSANCAENNDEPIQVLQFNSNTWILRQNKCVNYEAPFMFLFIGTEKALLVDTGATQDSVSFPLQTIIKELLSTQQQQTGKQLELIVIHSHSHSDHFAADTQFKDKLNTKVIGLTLQQVQDFFGFESWPEHEASINLGNRSLIIIPIPGHDEMSIALYDEQTKILLTGDSFYPGRLYVRDWPAFCASINRLTEFCEKNPVEWILGNHIEMKDSLGLDYPTGTTYQPNEQIWPLTVTELNFLNTELLNQKTPVRNVFPKFILEPLPAINEQDIESKAIHTITLAGYPDFLAADGSDVWVTNVDYVQKLAISSAKPLMQVRVPGNCGAPVVAYGSLWVASCKQKSVVRIDALSGKVLATIPSGVADLEGELSLAAGADAIWILSDAKGELARIDIHTNKVVANIPVEPDSYCATFEFGSVWITNTNASTVQRIDPTSNSVTATIPVDETPRFLAAGEGAVWTLNQKAGTVSMIDPNTNKVLATINTNVPGLGGDIATGTGRVWVRAKNNRMLQSVHPLTGKVSSIYGPLNGSGAVRVARNYVWVTAHDVHKVWVMR